MSRWKIFVPAALISIVAIAYFSGGPRVPMDGDRTSDLAVAEIANQDTPAEVQGGYGADIELGNGLTLNVSEPVTFEAKDFASLGVDGRPISMIITVANSGKKRIDMASFTILQSAFDSDASLSCSDVFEEASGIIGLPPETIIPPGKSVSFPWAIVCPTNKGDGMQLTFSVTGEEQVTLESLVP